MHLVCSRGWKLYIWVERLVEGSWRFKLQGPLSVYWAVGAKKSPVLCVAHIPLYYTHTPNNESRMSEFSDQQRGGGCK